MTDDLETLPVLLGLALVMLLLHLTIVPLAWLGAQISDGLETLRQRRRPLRARRHFRAA